MRAEEECLSDADRREAQRIRAAEQRALQEARYVDDFAHAVRESDPARPDGLDLVIVARACQKYSGRIGRSAAAKAFSPEAVDLAVGARIRHRWTRYDEYLMRGWDRDDARAAVKSQVDDVVLRWRGEVPD